MKKNIILLLLSLSIFSNVLAQSKQYKGSDQFFEQLKKQIQEDQKQLDKLLKEDANEMDQVINNLRQNFFGQLDQIFKSGRNNFLEGLKYNPGGEISTKWTENKTHKILEIIIPRDEKEDLPVDISIKNKQINIKISYKSNNRIFNAQNIVLIPADVDSENAEFKKSKKKILVLFKKLDVGKKANSTKSDKDKGLKSLPFDQENSI